jgi:hypothetical protein
VTGLVGVSSTGWAALLYGDERRCRFVVWLFYIMFAVRAMLMSCENVCDMRVVWLSMTMVFGGLFGGAPFDKLRVTEGGSGDTGWGQELWLWAQISLW